MKRIFKNRYNSQLDFNEIKEFKKIINYYGSTGLRDQILDQILKSKNIKADAESFYLTEEEIKYISNLGFEIGSHGISHTVMSRLSKEKQFQELTISKEFLENITKKSIPSFCYPYGRRDSYSSDTLELLRKTNYKNAVTVDPRDIDENDLLNNLYELPRYDCNQISKIFNL